MSSSFELRTSALNVQAASELLMTRDSVSGDKDAAFLANAAYTSCKQLLGIISNSMSAHATLPALVDLTLSVALLHAVIEARHLEHNELRVVKEVFTISKAVRDVLQTCTLGRQASWSEQQDSCACLLLFTLHARSWAPRLRLTSFGTTRRSRRPRFRRSSRATWRASPRSSRIL